MAGRGTDIMLGGNPEFLADVELRRRGLDPVETREEYEAAWDDVVAQMREQVKAEAEAVKQAGGLYVLGTERHESRRIDNQLRGRSGRQGDPGESRFYLSLDDDLMRRFNAQMIESIMNRVRLPDDVPIEAGMVTKAIRSAQTQVEQQNFEIRKNVLKYDEVLNKQRTVIYDERRRVLAGENIGEQIEHMLSRRHRGLRRGRNRRGLRRGLGPGQAVDRAGHPLPGRYPLAGRGRGARRHVRDSVKEAVLDDARAAYARREQEIDEIIGAQGGMRELERQVLLQVMDRKWREHLYEMDYLKEGIGLRAMAQRDPLIEYQREGFDMFAAMLEGIKEETIGHLFNVRVQAAEPPPPARARGRGPGRPGPGRAGDRPADAEDPGRAHAGPLVRSARQPRPRSGTGGQRAARRVPRDPPGRPELQRPGRGRRHRAVPSGGGSRQGPRRQPGRRHRHRRQPALPEPAVPVRLGAQVQAVPRVADRGSPLTSGRAGSAQAPGVSPGAGRCTASGRPAPRIGRPAPGVGRRSRRSPRSRRRRRGAGTAEAG